MEAMDAARMRKALPDVDPLDLARENSKKNARVFNPIGMRPKEYVRYRMANLPEYSVGSKRRADSGGCDHLRSGGGSAARAPAGHVALELPHRMGFFDVGASAS